MKKEDLEKMLVTLSDVIGKENAAMYSKIVGESGIERFDTPEEFHFAVIYPFKQFIEGYCKQVLNANDDVVFIYKNYNFLERHFSKLFKDLEGCACCADKSRTIINSLVRFYETGKRIEFNYAAEFTYHLPAVVLKEHDDIVMFYEGLRGLMYGDPKKYVNAWMYVNRL